MGALVEPRPTIDRPTLSHLLAVLISYEVEDDSFSSVRERHIAAHAAVCRLNFVVNIWRVVLSCALPVESASSLFVLFVMFFEQYIRNLIIYTRKIQLWFLLSMSMWMWM